MRYSIQHGNITTTASRGQGGSRFEPQPKGYGMSQNHRFECPQAHIASGPDASGQGFEWLQRHPSSGSSPGGNIESNPFGTVGKYVFRGTERSVEMPVVPSFMTCDLCDFLGDGLTLETQRTA